MIAHVLPQLLVMALAIWSLFAAELDDGGEAPALESLLIV